MMDTFSRPLCGWDKEIPHGVLLMEQLVLSDKWARNTHLVEVLSDFSPQIMMQMSHFGIEAPQDHRKGNVQRH